MNIIRSIIEIILISRPSSDIHDDFEDFTSFHYFLLAYLETLLEIDIIVEDWKLTWRDQIPLSLTNREEAKNNNDQEEFAKHAFALNLIITIVNYLLLNPTNC